MQYGARYVMEANDLLVFDQKNYGDSLKQASDELIALLIGLRLGNCESSKLLATFEMFFFPLRHKGSALLRHNTVAIALFTQRI